MTSSHGRTVAIVRVRMGSSRLPGKALRSVVGKPLLQLLLERLRRAKRLDGIVVATSTAPGDDAIEALARELGIPCHRGSEEDVLQRVLDAATAARADAIVEITGDCPLIDPETVDRVVAAFAREEVDYASNVLKRTYPRGLDTQVYRTRVLQEVAGLTRDPSYREHVSLYIYEHPERFTLHNVESGLDERCAGWRLTVDTPEDLALVEAIFERLYPVDPAFALDDVVRLLDARPDLLEINREIAQKPVR